MERQPRSPVEQQDSSLAHSIELDGPDGEISCAWCSANPIAIDPDETSRGSVPQGLAAIGWTLEDWTKLLDDIEAKLRELAWPCWVRVLIILLVLGGIGAGVAVAATSEEGFGDGPPIVSIVMFVVALAIFLATCKCSRSLCDFSVLKLLLCTDCYTISKFKGSLPQIQAPHGCAVRYFERTEDYGHGDNARTVTYRYVHITKPAAAAGV